ncbi:MAG: SH3 domain-containing protein [Gammaproteobacteria bacterium]
MTKILRAGLFALAAFAAYAAGGAAAEGFVLRAPAVLFDGPSREAAKLFILDAGHPLRQVSRVDGWRKAQLHGGEIGWVQDSLARQKRAAVVAEDLAAVRVSPSPSAAPVFYARKGVILEVLGESDGWLEVLHAGGETGYAPSAALWKND